MTDASRRPRLVAARPSRRSRARSRTSSRRCSSRSTFLHRAGAARVPRRVRGAEGRRRSSAGSSSPTTCRSSTGCPAAGMGPAVVGTLLITGAAALMAIPLGILGGIYLNEYGGRSRSRGSIRFLSEVMTGVPVDRDGPVHLHVRRAEHEGAERLRRRARAGVPHAADRDPHHRPDALARARASCGRAATRSGAARCAPSAPSCCPSAARRASSSGALHRGGPRRGRDRTAAVHHRHRQRDRTGACSTARTRRCRCRSSSNATLAVHEPRRTGPGARRSR